MKLFFISLFLIVNSITSGYALIINEIMSNPTGDDGGREWVEIYNESSSAVDLSQLTISVKGVTAIPVTHLSGDTMLPAKGYAIISSTVSGATKFLQDYGTYNGPHFKSSISLVNTGITSLEIKLGGVSVYVVPSYTAAKEGLSLSLFDGNYKVSTPTPGSDNLEIGGDVGSVTNQSTTTVAVATTTNQVTLAQATPPLANIVIYMPFEKVAIAGAETELSVFAMTRENKPIDKMVYTWAYGDGGQGVGSSTLYRYAYPGNYIAQVEGTNGYLIGNGRMHVRVVSPDIKITKAVVGKYGPYIDIENPNPYDLDFSQWRLTIDGASFPFPKNTLLVGNNVTHIVGSAMGFSHIVFSSTTLIKILFPNQEEVERYVFPDAAQHSVSLPGSSTNTIIVSTTTQASVIASAKKIQQSMIKPKEKLVPAFNKVKSMYGNTPSPTSSKELSLQATNTKREISRDTRMASFLKGIFSR